MKKHSLPPCSQQQYNDIAMIERLNAARKAPEPLFERGAPMFRPLEALVADADVETCGSLTEVLLRNGLIPVCCSTLNEAQSILLRHSICLVLSNYTFPDGDFHDVLAAVEGSASRVPVILTCRTIDSTKYLDAMSSGAFDCIEFPWASRELHRIVSHALNPVPVFASEPTAMGQERLGGDP
jgi:DNA-binding NtrC family response regulator